MRCNNDDITPKNASYYKRLACSCQKDREKLDEQVVRYEFMLGVLYDKLVSDDWISEFFAIRQNVLKQRETA